jgi:hypothetical protein
MSALGSGCQSLIAVLAGVALLSCEREKNEPVKEAPGVGKPTTVLLVPASAPAGPSAQVLREVEAPFEIPTAPPYGVVKRPVEYQNFPTPEEMERLQKEQYRELKEQRSKKSD